MRRFFTSSYFWLILIVLLSAGLRFYKLSQYLQFLGDQGRDVLVVKRMIIDHQWTLLGPSASVGGFYTGAIYYYLMLPFLWLWHFDPVGPAVMTGLFGIGAVILIFFFCQKLFGSRIAVLASFLTAISPGMIYVSRYSWNPNPIPFFSLLTMSFLYLSLTRKKLIFTLLTGIGLGLIVQLHYMALAMGPVVLLPFLVLLPKKDWLKHLVLLGIGFLAGESMFLLFEIRHDFANTQHVLEFVTRGHGATVSPRGINILAALDDVAKRVYEAVFGFSGPYLKFFYYGSIVGFVGWVFKQKKSPAHKVTSLLIAIWLVVGLLIVSFYRGTLDDHYLVSLFPLPIILLAIALGWLLKNKYLLPIFVLVFSVFVFMEIKSEYFWQGPNNLVEQTKTIDKRVLELTKNQPYNFALISHGNTDSAYRYFLELWGKPPRTIENPVVDPARKSVTKQLIVVCEEKCGPLGSSLWEVAGFGRADIVSQENSVGGITIYKLVHYMGK